MADPRTTYLDDGDVRLYHGDVRVVLDQLPAGSVQTCVTSPPYWGLRDYGTGTWAGGDPDHEHDTVGARGGRGGSGAPGKQTTDAFPSTLAPDTCQCGAARVDAQLGLEDTPELFVAALVDVFRSVWRVLKDDGTCWINLGDSYAGSPNDTRGTEMGHLPRASRPKRGLTGGTRTVDVSLGAKRAGLKPKDLVGIPWRVAFALQADGWVLRSDVVWAKPNPMPESVTDRPTKSHEMLFLFAKGKWTGAEPGRFARTISDADARWLALLFDTEGNIVVKRAEVADRLQFGAQMAFANCSRDLIERAQGMVGMGSIHERPGTNAPIFYWQMTGQQARDLLHRIYPHLIVKHRQAAVAIYMQDVIAEPKRRPGGYRTAEHEAFLVRCWETVKSLNRFGDPDLSWVPEPKYGRWIAQPYFFDADAIREPHNDKAGGPERFGRTRHHHAARDVPMGRSSFEYGVSPADGYNPAGRNKRSVWEIATQPTPEAHFATFPEALVRPCILAGSRPGDTVLDPFMGSGTTALVARKHGRRSVGVDLSAEYLQIAARRLQQLSLFAVDVQPSPGAAGIEEGA